MARPLPAQNTSDARSALPDAFTPEQLRWELSLGSHQYTVPRIDGEHVFLGINDQGIEHPAVRSTGGGILMCRERAGGALVWQLPIPRYMEGTQAPYHFNHWKCGVCSRPAVDGDFVYIVGPRGDVLCLDRQGQADGNDGPYVDELGYMKADSDYNLRPTDGDIIWRFDMIADLGIVPHDVCGSSPVVVGDYVYACTSNGVDHTHRRVANPEAPNLIALDKRTGRLAAVDDTPIRPNIYLARAVVFAGRSDYRDRNARALRRRRRPPLRVRSAARGST